MTSIAHSAEEYLVCTRNEPEKDFSEIFQRSALIWQMRGPERGSESAIFMKPFGGIRTQVLFEYVGGWMDIMGVWHTSIAALSQCHPLFSHWLGLFTLLSVAPTLFRGRGAFISRSLRLILSGLSSNRACKGHLSQGSWQWEEGEEEGGGHIITCFHFQFFRKTGLPLVFGKCFQSNNQLWRRRSRPLIFNEPKLMRCHNDSDFLKLLNEASLVSQPLSWKIVMNMVGCRWCPGMAWSHTVVSKLLLFAAMPRKWAVSPHFKNQNEMIMIFPVFVKSYLQSILHLANTVFATFICKLSLLSWQRIYLIYLLNNVYWAPITILKIEVQQWKRRQCPWYGSLPFSKHLKKFL